MIRHNIDIVKETAHSQSKKARYSKFESGSEDEDGKIYYFSLKFLVITIFFRLDGNSS